MKKNIIITGTATGFGLLGVKTLAAKGHTVFATMRDIQGRNASAAKELEDWASANGYQVYVAELDVTSNASVKTAVDQIAEKTSGKIDVLINNAGLGYMGTAEALAIEETEMLYQVNVFGPERMMKAVLPYMRKEKSGLIINVTSAMSRNHFAILGTYASTKSALDAASVGYHYELAPSGIDVVTIQPGAYPTTDIIDKGLRAKNEELDNEMGDDVIQMKKSIFAYFEPTPESPDPQEVADTMLQLVDAPQGSRPMQTVINGGPLTEMYKQINDIFKQGSDIMVGVLLGKQ